MADSGYCSEKNLEALESAGQPERRIEGYIATERQKHDEYREACPKGPLPKGRDAGRPHETEAKNQSGKSRVRGAQGDSVWSGQARAWVPAVSLRGLDKVRGEWSLVCLTHNILKCYRLCYE